MIIRENLKKFINLSLISFIISFVLLNSLTHFFSINVSLKIVLCFLFFFNFYRLKKIYNVKNTFKFFIFFFLLIFISRFLEYQIFIYLFSILKEKNITWLITILVSSIFKFIYLEFLNFFKV